MSSPYECERPTLRDVRYPSITRMTDGYPAYVKEELPEGSQEARLIRQNVALLQGEISRAVADDVVGLNLRAINAYYDQRGYNVEPYHVISADELQDVSARLRRSYVTQLGDSHGLYTPYARISLIKRDHEREEMFNRSVTERVVAHEMAHSSSDHDHIQFTGTTADEIIENTHMPRIGNRYIPYAPAGHPERAKNIEYAFAEEAFAELTASDYLFQTYIPTFEDPQTGFKLELEDQELWLPARHVNCVPGDEGAYRTTFNTPAMAAYAYEILNQVDPDHQILNLMIQGRKDVVAYIEIDQRLDAMGVDNLAQAMKDVTYSPGGFLAGLQIAEFVAAEHGITTRPSSMTLPSDVYRPESTVSPYDSGMASCTDIDPIFDVYPSSLAA
ncbi:MAG: hypothetical protein KIH63_003250 [Candidatus Saccharibacteria bacterium]|nr:hypothetical protein [Candidatus Saccharibacteria bacterium]